MEVKATVTRNMALRKGPIVLPEKRAPKLITSRTFVRFSLSACNVRSVSGELWLSSAEALSVNSSPVFTPSSCRLQHPKIHRFEPSIPLKTIPIRGMERCL